MTAPYVVHPHSGPMGTPRGKWHLSADKRGPAICGAEGRTVAGFLTWGNRAEFEQHVPERICKRCRKAESA